jgi:hypothetical protein
MRKEKKIKNKLICTGGILVSVMVTLDVFKVLLIYILQLYLYAEYFVNLFWVTFVYYLPA